MEVSFCIAKEAASVLPNKKLPISENFRRHSLNFILHLSYLLDILGVMNHWNCYLQEPASNIVDFAIKLTTSGVGKVPIASHVRVFNPRNVVLQLFGRNTADYCLFCNFTYTPHFQLLCGQRFFLCSLTHRLQLFHCSTFPQVALLMKILLTLRLLSFKSSAHNNDSDIVRFLRSSELCYLLFASA